MELLNSQLVHTKTSSSPSRCSSSSSSSWIGGVVSSSEEPLEAIGLSGLMLSYRAFLKAVVDCWRYGSEKELVESMRGSGEMGEIRLGFQRLLSSAQKERELAKNGFG